MKLIEALQLIKHPPRGSASFKVFLVCGFTPLHLDTFLKANLMLVFPDRRVEIHTGLYGDFVGNLERAGYADVDAAVAVLEWADLDRRLGIRNLGGWGLSRSRDILDNLHAQAERVERAAERISRNTLLTISLATLPLPPIGHTQGWQAGELSLQARACISSLAVRLAKYKNVRVVNPQRLEQLSCPAERLNVKSAILTGFPYNLGHAAGLSELLARAIQNPIPRKGLISDLDDTLWDGILGEVGVDGISWDLDHHSHMHGLYQQLLNALSENGVLIAVATKNERGLVEEAFNRSDLIFSMERVFPVEAHWGPKSESVARILQKWNVGADSVAFVDDNPIDLAEVSAAYPAVECLIFPKNDYQACYELMWRLLDLFGKETISQEDALRVQSLRQATKFAEDSKRAPDSPDVFLQQVAGELVLNFEKDPLDARALELINKTNQFNLNGKRYTETSWQTYLDKPEVFSLVAAYEDKYGPLGKIAVVAGRREGRVLEVDLWVMSCRAFSRRIEHKCLEQLFEQCGVEEIAFNFVPTLRNGPLQNFFAEFLGTPPQAAFRLRKGLFSEMCPQLFQRVREIVHG